MKAILLLAATLAIIRPQQAPSETRGIYDVVLKQIFERGIPDPLVVAAEYREMYPPEAATWQALAGVPNELRQRIGTAPPIPPPGAQGTHAATDFAAAIRLVPIAEIRELVRTPPRGSYQALQQKYGAASFVSLSKPVSSADGLDVMVHWSHGCGTTCGAQGYIWLHRKSRTDPWVAKKVVTAVG